VLSSRNLGALLAFNYWDIGNMRSNSKQINGHVISNFFYTQFVRSEPMSKQQNQYIAARKNFERAVGRLRPAPGLLPPGSRPPPRTSLVCSLPAPGALNSHVLLRIPIGSVDVGTTTTLLAARALPNNCSCVYPNCQHNPASPSPALL